MIAAGAGFIFYLFIYLLLLFFLFKSVLVYPIVILLGNTIIVYSGRKTQNKQASKPLLYLPFKTKSRT